MKQKILLLLLGLMLVLSACGKKPQTSSSTTKIPRHKIVVYCTDQFRTSGLEATTLPDFTKKHDCKVELVMFPNSLALSKAIKDPANYGAYDLVLGIDNAFVASESLAVYFAPPEKFDPGQLTPEAMFDPQKRLLPYAYANLCLLYNSAAIPNPPQSFGELQNARYLHQMAICDPHEAAVGRATLFWSLALFGTEGYEHLWKSLRKNIYKSYANQQDALAALKKGECNLMLGLSTIPAHWQELDPGQKNFAASNLKEGSYLYVESIGLHRGSTKPALASKFISHFLDSDTQKMVVYKLGMFPANRKTLLPMHFSSIPFNSYSVNSRLSQATINGQLQQWLEFWDRLFGYQIS